MIYVALEEGYYTKVIAVCTTLQAAKAACEECEPTAVWRGWKPGVPGHYFNYAEVGSDQRTHGFRIEEHDLK